MPLLKRIFGQGKSKTSNTLVALCIGDYGRLTLPIWGLEDRHLEALLATDGNGDDGSPSTSQPAQQRGSVVSTHQTSFKGFRHLLQHFGGASSPSQDGADADSQQQLSQFLKQLGGYPSVSFVTAAEDGFVSKDRVVAKLTKLFKQSTAPVVLVLYCGPSDERGNWRLAGQINSSSSIGGVSGGPGSVSSAGGGAAGCSGTGVVSFREVSMLWQRHRKHSQRLVLLLDCANSGYWVSALRMLSKAEQLELSLGVQASDSSHHTLQGSQLNYQPGIFLQCFLSNNKWRRTHQPQAGSVQGGTAASTGRGEQWLPGMTPTYYATWLNDNLVDYGVALRFFNMQAVTPSVHSGPSGALAVKVDSPESMGIASPGPKSDSEAVRGCWRPNGMGGLASGRALHVQVGRLADDVTSPGSDLLGSRGTLSLPRTPEDPADRPANPLLAAQAQNATRAASVPDAVRRRISVLTDFFTGSGDAAATSIAQPLPNNPAVERVRLSTPQHADWTAPVGQRAAFGTLRSPTLPGDDSLYKMAQADADGSAGTLSQVGTGAHAQGSLSVYGTLCTSMDDMASGRAGGAASTSTSPQQPSFLTSGEAKPPRSAWAASAVHPCDVGGAGEDDSAFGPAGGPAVADDGLSVQTSARSDTVAVAWAQRSTHADRCLMEGERGRGGMSSFTAATRPPGFASELFGALHEVATDRKLRARRAPLEGDESMDTMMEDADLDRRASLASLPSAMLPRELVAEASETLAEAAHHRALCTTAVQFASRNFGTMASPRTSFVGHTTATGMDSGTWDTSIQHRHPSRLFLVSMGVANAADPAAVSALEEARAGGERVEEGEGEGEEGDDEELSLSICVQDPQGRAQQQQQHGNASQQYHQSFPHSGQHARHPSGQHQTLRRQVQGKSVKNGSVFGKAPQHGDPVHGEGEGEGGDGSLVAVADVDGTVLDSSHTSMDLLQPTMSAAASGPQSAAPSSSERPRVRSSVFGVPSSSMLRSVLKAHVSIADTAELDSASFAGTPTWQRRPGRFEMAGSESSSFVFGDDKERFEMLKLLREQQDAAGGAVGHEEDEEGRLLVPDAALPPDAAAAGVASAEVPRALEVDGAAAVQDLPGVEKMGSGRRLDGDAAVAEAQGCPFAGTGSGTEVGFSGAILLSVEGLDSAAARSSTDGSAGAQGPGVVRGFSRLPDANR